MQNVNIEWFENDWWICISFIFSQPVRDFFCFDDPPGPHESLEESRVSKYMHVIRGCSDLCDVEQKWWVWDYV